MERQSSLLGSAKLDCRGGDFRFANGILLAKLSPPAELTRLFVMFAFAKLFVQAASFEQLFETAKGGTDRLFVVDAHP